MEHPMYSLRILSKGRVSDLSKGFTLGGVPFSVFVRPKKASMETNILMPCKLICDKESGAFPVPLGDWTPGAIVVFPQMLFPWLIMRSIGELVN